METAVSEQAQAFIERYRAAMLTTEPDFVEGERVALLVAVNGYDVGDTGTVCIEWIDEKFGVPCNCWGMFVVMDGPRQTVLRSDNMELLVKSVDPRWSREVSKNGSVILANSY